MPAQQMETAVAKPPKTPPSSDIGGAGARDSGQSAEQPQDGDPKQGETLRREEQEARARPRESRP